MNKKSWLGILTNNTKAFRIAMLVFICLVLTILLVFNISISHQISKTQLERNYLESQLEKETSGLLKDQNSIKQQIGIRMIKKGKVGSITNNNDAIHKEVIKIQHSILENRNHKENHRERRESLIDRLSIVKYRNDELTNQLENAKSLNEKLSNELKELNSNIGKKNDKDDHINDKDLSSMDAVYYDSSILFKKNIALLRLWLKDKILLVKCYDMRRDGLIPKIFHQNCDDKKPTISLVKTMTDEVIGGYTALSWGGGNDMKFDPTAFIFSLTKQKMFPLDPGKYSTIANTNNFIRFAHDLLIEENGSGFSYFPINYGSRAENCLRDFVDQESFSVKEMEVYQVVKMFLPK